MNRRHPVACKEELISALSFEMAAHVLLPRSTEDFGDAAYWDQFFSQGDVADFEWYTDSDTLMPIIDRHASSLAKHDVRILIPGCGTSDLPFQLHTKGYKNLYPCDYSDVALACAQTKRRESDSRIQFYKRDACKFSTYTDAEALDWFKPSSIDMIIDKGLLDSISSNLSACAVSQCSVYLHEMKRLVKADDAGLLLIVTMAQPRVLDILHSEFPLETWSFVVYFIPPLPNDANRYQPIVIALTQRMLKKVEMPHSYILDSRLLISQRLPNAATKLVESSFDSVKLAIAEEQCRHFQATTSESQKKAVCSKLAKSYCIEVKPADVDTNLDELRTKVENFLLSYNDLHCQSIQLQPIAYGLQKLVLNVSDSSSKASGGNTVEIDGVVEAMQDYLGEDLVQSIDLLY